MEVPYPTAALSMGFEQLFDMNGILSIMSSVLPVIHVFVVVGLIRLAGEAVCEMGDIGRAAFRSVPNSPDFSLPLGIGGGV